MNRTMKDRTKHVWVPMLVGLGFMAASGFAQEAGADGAEAPAAGAPTGGAPAAAGRGQPTPRTPLVSRAPMRAEWTVRMTTDFSDSWQTEDRDPVASAALAETRTIRSVQYVKDGELQTFRLRTRWSDGESEDEWIIMGNHVAERPGGRGLYVVGSEVSTAQDLARTDFPELGWLDMIYYRGVRSYRGKPVFAFSVPYDQRKLTAEESQLLHLAKQQDPQITPSKLFKPKVSEILVYLDAVTQLPVMYNDGTVLRRYDFSPPSDTRLRPPQKYIDFLRTRDEALRVRLTPPAGPGGPGAE
jgi:hypothetical protein